MDVFYFTEFTIRVIFLILQVPRSRNRRGIVESNLVRKYRAHLEEIAEMAHAPGRGRSSSTGSGADDPTATSAFVRSKAGSKRRNTDERSSRFSNSRSTLQKGLGAGKRSVERLFQQWIGMTFGKWRQQLRLTLEFRDQLLVLLDGAPGTRRGELAALRWQHCDSENDSFQTHQ
jgi:hypothetical protein